MLEIDVDFWINPDCVTAVKAAGSGKSVLYFSGEDALGGHILDRDAREVAEDLSDALGQDLTSVFDEPEEEEEE